MNFVATELRSSDILAVSVTGPGWRIGREMRSELAGLATLMRVKRDEISGRSESVYGYSAATVGLSLQIAPELAIWTVARLALTVALAVLEQGEQLARAQTDSGVAELLRWHAVDSACSFVATPLADFESTISEVPAPVFAGAAAHDPAN